MISGRHMNVEVLAECNWDLEVFQNLLLRPFPLWSRLHGRAEAKDEQYTGASAVSIETAFFFNETRLRRIARMKAHQCGAGYKIRNLFERDAFRGICYRMMAHRAGVLVTKFGQCYQRTPRILEQVEK